MAMKQIIVMRKDLGMRAGKMVAQGAHASLKVTLENLGDWNVRDWLNEKFTKICVRVESEEELLSILQSAKDEGLIASLIVDAGLTEFNGVPTKTCIAVGPGPIEKVDKVTGHLKLL